MAHEMPGADEQSPLRELKLSDGVLTLGGTRVVITLDRAYALFQRVIYEHAPHIVRYAFYDMGYRTGEQIVSSLLGRAPDPEQAFRYLVETYKHAGYGDIKVVSFSLDGLEIWLEGTNLFEAALAQQTGIYRSPRAVDYYSRGVFAGFAAALAGQEAVCEEMSCQFRGDDVCRFVVLPARASVAR